MAVHDRTIPEISFLTVTEVARIARVSKMTVYREIQNGRLTSVRIGRSFRIQEDDARRWMSAPSDPIG